MNLNNEMIQFGIPILEGLLAVSEESTWDLGDDFSRAFGAESDTGTLELIDDNMAVFIEISFFKALINHLKVLQENEPNT